MTDGTFVSPFAVEDPEALAATERVQAELARTTGRLVDAVVRTRVDDARSPRRSRRSPGGSWRSPRRGRSVSRRPATGGCATTATPWSGCATPSRRRCG